MKLCRYGEKGAEKPGIIGPSGEIRDLSAHCKDIGPDTLSPEALKKLATLNVQALPVVHGTPRYGSAVTDVSKFIAIGLNFHDHAEEAGMAIPTEPIIFMKAPSCISGANDDIIRPLNSTKLDWEVELGIVIGSKAQYVPEESALDYVAGYCVINDVSERAFQLQSPQWDKGKGCDSFGPIGPWLVTTDEIPDPQDLDMWLDVNGRRMQTGNSRTMIFDCKKIVAYCSNYMTLLPGDVITTGTPPGVGMGFKPEPIYLNVGDVLTLSIQGLGRQTQTVRELTQ